MTGGVLRNAASGVSGHMPWSASSVVATYLQENMGTIVLGGELYSASSVVVTVLFRVPVQVQEHLLQCANLVTLAEVH